MNKQSLAILDTIIRESTLRLFAAFGVNLGVVSSLPENLDHTFSASIGFTNPSMPGMLIMTLDRELVARSRPAELQAGPLTEPDLDDWVGELVNQLIGRIKNQLLRHQIELEQSIPSVVRGRWLRRGIPGAAVSCPLSFSHGSGTVYVCFDAMAQEALELKTVVEECEGISEGEVALF